MEVYGTNLANVISPRWTGTDFKGSAPTAFGGTTVTIAGQSAFIDYASPSHVNAQAFRHPPGSAEVIVNTPRGTSAGLVQPLRFS